MHTAASSAHEGQLTTAPPRRWGATEDHEVGQRVAPAGEPDHFSHKGASISTIHGRAAACAGATDERFSDRVARGGYEGVSGQEWAGGNS